MFLRGCNAMSHISESTVLMENNLTQPKRGRYISIVAFCGKFFIPVHESFYKKLPVHRCKRLGTAGLG